MARKPKIEAVAYLRTSSAANVGPDKDSDRRQRDAITAFAKRAGYEIVEEFYDAAVSGADYIEDRRGFRALLDRIKSNGVRTVIVESADRFARELMVQELGISKLIKLGVQVVTASGDDLTSTDEPSRTMMRQIAGSFAEYEKARLVEKLRKARDRKSAEKGARIEGRPALEPLWKRYPDAVRMAKRLHRANPKSGERRSLREISAELARAGHVMVSQYRNKGKGSEHASREKGEGRPFNPATIKAMIDGPRPADTTTERD
jgi:DNA invertase Pin-like site-specific DNA recombinase